MTQTVSNNNFSNLSEAELIALTKNGNDHAFEELAVRYLSVILAKASTFRCVHSDLDDFIQEGLLALLQSAKAYDPKNTATFATFANGNINRRFLSVYKKEFRLKDVPISKMVSISDTDGYLLETDVELSPEQTIINEEAYKSLKKRILQKLSPMEHKVFSYYVSGLSYEEISAKLNISFKSVDNALQRIRKKLK